MNTPPIPAAGGAWTMVNGQLLPDQDDPATAARLDAETAPAAPPAPTEPDAPAPTEDTTE